MYRLYSVSLPQIGVRKTLQQFDHERHQDSRQDQYGDAVSDYRFCKTHFQHSSGKFVFPYCFIGENAV